MQLAPDNIERRLTQLVSGAKPDLAEDPTKNIENELITIGFKFGNSSLHTSSTEEAA